MRAPFRSGCLALLTVAAISPQAARGQVGGADRDAVAGASPPFVQAAPLRQGQVVTLRIRQVIPRDGLSAGDRVLNGLPALLAGDRVVAEVIAPASHPPALVGGTVGNPAAAAFRQAGQGDARAGPARDATDGRIGTGPLGLRPRGPAVQREDAAEDPPGALRRRGCGGRCQHGGGARRREQPLLHRRGRGHRALVGHRLRQPDARPRGHPRARRHLPG